MCKVIELKSAGNKKPAEVRQLTDEEKLAEFEKRIREGTDTLSRQGR